MSIDLLKDIIITESDIDWIENVMGNTIHFDYDRREIIKCLDSIDIQAFPGSGKTTLLVAKLAILAKKWPFSNKGICVLSHTNVAREEIEKRLGKSDVGRKLLSYPHFIGTVHSFADTFITKPWLNSCGINIEIIDSDIVLEKRWKSLRYGTINYLKKRNKNQSICQYYKEIGKIDIESQGKVFENLAEVIRSSTMAGYLTFDEVLLHAKRALEIIPLYEHNIQTRFPILFIDEAQDTDSMQWDVINLAFPEATKLSVRQGFGDSNQAIFSKTSDAVNINAHFPRTSFLLLKESRRFDDKLATLANTATLSSNQMIGSENEFTSRPLKHTLFLFSRDAECSRKVVDAYAELLLKTFSDDELEKYSKDGCYVIGTVHHKNSDTDEKSFPRGIYDYWDEYDANKSKHYTPRLLIEYFRNGSHSFKLLSDTNEQIEWIAKGICKLLKYAKSETVVNSSGHALRALCKELSLEDEQKLRRWLYKCTTFDLSNESEWNLIKKHLPEVLNLFGKYINNSSLNEFTKWTAEISGGIDEVINKSNRIPNVYSYTNSEGRTVDLHFGSIHNVKGRTHLSTMIVETYYKTHNIKKIVPYLANATKAKKKAADYGRFKCQYVAMTRARALLCMAIPLEFVNDEQKKNFAELGWNIVEII